MRAALTRVDGLFPYATILYSAVKKSGKTRVAAGVAAWFAATGPAYNEVYCLANDGKQSSDRILSAIKQAVKLSPTLNWSITKTRIELPNGTFIEAIPCDPSGQAGSNPGLTVWSEIWGYRLEHKNRLWSEMTVPPTRWGHAFRWVESYAGYTDESSVLETLYNLGVKDSYRHPAFKNLPVYINDAASMFCYWDEQPRMVWQNDEYYAQEAAVLPPNEFSRIHRNQWVSSTEKAIEIEWWDGCEDVVIDGEELPALTRTEPVVLALDASVSHDCCAVAIVTRHPQRRRDVAIRGVKIWEPPAGGKIDLTATMDVFVRDFCGRHNVLYATYDEFQLHKLATDLRKDGVVAVREFSQHGDRAIADKQLYDLIIQRQLVHTGDPIVRAHVDNAQSKHTGDRLRFVKPETRVDSAGRTRKPIDALVAMSMGSFEILRLAI